MGDVMSADEARARLDGLVVRLCSECDARDPTEAADRTHVGCPCDPPGRAYDEHHHLTIADTERALRAVIALRPRIPDHAALVYRADATPPDVAALVGDLGDAVVVVEYRDPDAPGATAADWDSHIAAKRCASLGDGGAWTGERVEGGRCFVVVGAGAPSPATWPEAWTAGAAAARADDLTTLQCQRERMAREGRDGDAQVVAAAEAEVERRPLPAPPAPSQSPLAPSDGGTEPGGGGAPGRGLPVAVAADDERRERLRALDLAGALSSVAGWATAARCVHCAGTGGYADGRTCSECYGTGVGE